MQLINEDTTGIKEKNIEEIIELAKEYGIDKVYLYGSRARGDYKKKSDVDIAVTGGDVNGFILAIDEEVSTLLMFDVVGLDSPIQDELLESIKKEGILIYEKN